MARPSIEITDDLIKKAEAMAAQGLTLEQVAKTLGMAYQTLNEKRKEFTELSEAIKRGQAKGIAKVTNALFNKAINGDNTAMIFYLKNRDKANWGDQEQNTGTDLAGTVAKLIDRLPN